jgi:NTE family protein
VLTSARIVPTQPQTSFILAGGVVKSSFEAGAIKVLTDRGVLANHVLAASAGALNGILYSAAIRAGREREAADQLELLWIENGDLGHGFDFSPRTILRRQGVATTDKLVELMRSQVEPVATLPAVRPVAFTVVITSFNGRTMPVDGQPTTTFECERTFRSNDFATADGRERIYQVCAASSAFPLLFAPVEVPDVGPCIDGGAVNNSPITFAITAGAERVVLIAPTATKVPAQGSSGGFDLVSQLAEILIGERLYRDLRQTERANQVLAALDRMVAEDELTAAQATTIEKLLGYKRHVQVISIRPPTPLPGNVFSGLVNETLRTEYVTAGRVAAAAALDAHGIH